MKSRHLLLPLLMGLSLAASAMPAHLKFSYDERGRLMVRYPKAGSGFTNSELQCTTDLRNWIPLADGLTTDGDDYLIETFAVAPQEFFRVVSRPPFAFDPPDAPGPGEFMFPDEDGKLRKILVFIPDGYPDAAPPAPPAETGPVLCEPAWPLAIIYHGSGQNSASFSNRHPDLIAKCNTEGVILVIPQGTRNPIVPPHKHSWNSHEFIQRRDDVLFTIRLIERMKSRLRIDEERLYLGGFSNGGAFSQVAAVRTPRLFAAAAAVGSGAPSDDPMDPTNQPVCPAPGLPFLGVNGKIDFARPYYGGGSCPLPSLPVGGVCPSPPILGSASAMANWWQEVNGCTGTAPLLTTLADYDPAHPILTWPGLTSPDIPQQVRDDLNSDLPSIGDIQTWCPQVYPCPGAFEVNLVTINALGHTWPDAADNVGYDANEEVIDFFLRHRKVPMKDDGSFAAVARTAGGIRGPLLPDAPGNNPNVIYKIPANSKAIVLVCHGANQESTFVDCVEMTDTLDDLTAAGIGWVAWDSDVAGSWDLANGPSANQDLQNATAIRDNLIAMGLFGQNHPLYTMGYDQGALFALLLGHTLDRRGDPIQGIAQLSPDFDVPPPGATNVAAQDTRLPLYLFVTECDPVADKLQSLKYYQRLRYRSQLQMEFSRLCVSVEKCPDQSRFDRIVPPVDSAGVMSALENQGLIALDQGAWRRDFCKTKLLPVLGNLGFPPALGLTAEQEKEVRGQVRVIFAAHEPDAGCAEKLATFFCDALAWEPETPGNPDDGPQN